MEYEIHKLKVVTWVTVCLSLTLVFLRSAVARSTCKEE